MKNYYKVILISILLFNLCGCTINQTENRTNNRIMEEEVIMEKENNKSIELKDRTHLNDNVVNQKKYDEEFTVLPKYGNDLMISVQNDSDAELIFIVYKDGKQIERIEMSPQDDKTVKLNINKQTDYRVLIEVANGTNKGVFSGVVRARQYN